jgi:cysteine synthase
VTSAVEGLTCALASTASYGLIKSTGGVQRQIDPAIAHKIDGVGAGFVVPLWHENVADQIDQVSTLEAMTMVDRLAREEGLFEGTSTGCNVIAPLQMGR